MMIYPLRLMQEIERNPKLCAKLLAILADPWLGKLAPDAEGKP